MLSVLALSGGELTMGGMAAARCFSCFRSSGFCGEEFSLASLAVLSRLGRGDSNLDTKHACQLGNAMDKLRVPSLPQVPHPSVLCCQAQRTYFSSERSVLDHCSLLGIWALEHITHSGFQPCKLLPWPQTCLDGSYHSKDFSIHHEDACLTGGCSVGKSATLPKARGTCSCWGGVSTSTLVGCRRSQVILVYESRHRGERNPAQQCPATNRGSFATG